ncbi:MAG: methyltransferase GidB [Thermoleophilia bacterium]|nr:methyltransferase GidB [Thermoleophilia bacterium]
MKQLHDRYLQAVQSGPDGLFSRGDTARLADHIADGVAGAAVVRSLNPTSLVDVGSGGGIPGIPLAIELDDVDVHLVESLGWKAEFLLACVRALDLESRVTVHGLRAEEAITPIGRAAVDVGTARAVAPPIVVAEYLAPLVREGGHLVLWTTADHAARDEVRPRPELGLGEPDVVPAPSPLRDQGVLLVWPRTGPCEDRFPRRVGVAAKRPLR